MPAIIKVVDGRTIIKVGENTVAARAAASLAEQFAINAQNYANDSALSADAAAIAAAAIGVYTTVAAGEAATTDGQSFYVASGGTVTLYINNSGTGDAVATLVTSTTLAAPTGSGLIGWIQSGVGAVLRWITDKLRERVSVKDFGAIGNGIADDTDAIEKASAYLASIGGGLLHFPAGTYNYTRLTLRSEIIFQGDGPRASTLICKDPTTLDAGVTIGSSFRAIDNNQRVQRAGFRDIGIHAGSTSGVVAQQEIYKDVIGLNLTMCERGVIENVAMTGWGQGAVVMGSAHNGIEGLGFVNSLQDGNYWQVRGLYLGASGKYNADNGAVYLNYKSNSNKFNSIFAKGMAGSGAVCVAYGNDNLFVGGTAESCDYIFRVGGKVSANGNTIIGFRAEGVYGNAYEFKADGARNFVISGYHTGVDGELFVDANGSNRILSDRLNNLKTHVFPPVSDVGSSHNHGALEVTSVNGDADYPLFIKSKTYDDPAKYPVQRFYSTVLQGAAGAILGRVDWHNSDTSGGAAGVSAAVDAVLQDGSGNTSLVFSTGTGTTLAEKFRIRSNGAQVSVLPTSSATLAANSTMTMALTSDTNLKISVRGSDGVTRTVDLTLA